RDSRVVEAGAHPGGRRVAASTIDERRVVRRPQVDRPDVLRILEVAALAAGIRAQELAGLGGRMAAEASHAHVRPRQGKASAAVRRINARGIPVRLGVAGETLDAEPAPMEIFVAAR